MCCKWGEANDIVKTWSSSSYMWKSGKAREDPANQSLLAKIDQNWFVIQVIAKVNQNWFKWFETRNRIRLHLPPRKTSNDWSVAVSLKIIVKVGRDSNIFYETYFVPNFQVFCSPFQVCFLRRFKVATSILSITEVEPSIPTVMIILLMSFHTIMFSYSNNNPFDVFS